MVAQEIGTKAQQDMKTKRNFNVTENARVEGELK